MGKILVISLTASQMVIWDQETIGIRFELRVSKTHCMTKVKRVG